MVDIPMYYFFVMMTWLTPCVSNDPAQRQEPVDGIRIAWDRTTLQQLSPTAAKYAGYARMIVLHDGTLFCVYECQGATHAIRSLDQGNTWTAPTIVAAAENGIARVVPEVLQLRDHSILVSYNLRPPGNNTDSTKRFAIEVKRSVDGHQWLAPVRIYTAGPEFSNGCWEPAQLQLPTGEIQLFMANEGPYTQTNEQEITLFRSHDNGAHWTAGERVSFRSKHRDGMPVPLLLKNGKEIVYAIEDNGMSGESFVPVIIRTPAIGAWKNAPVLAGSADRTQALEVRNRVPASTYAGAPYIRQLPSGETLLSYQSTEWRYNAPWDRSDMVVAIGDEEARNFNRKSRPFYFTDSTKTCLWNSIAVLNDTTVVALGSTNGLGPHTAVWMIKGYVVPPVSAPRHSAHVKLPLFIGGYGPTQARLGLAWDDRQLYIHATVKDAEVVDNQKAKDGLQFYLDPGNQSTATLATGIFTVSIDVAGTVTFAAGEKGKWIIQKPARIEKAVTRISGGYQIEVRIPWSVLGTKPGASMRFHAVLNDIAATGHTYTEPLSGNDRERPYTWSSVKLVTAQNEHP
jgi:hypothetical protein